MQEMILWQTSLVASPYIGGGIMQQNSMQDITEEGGDFI